MERGWSCSACSRPTSEAVTRLCGSHTGVVSSSAHARPDLRTSVEPVRGGTEKRARIPASRLVSSVSSLARSGRGGGGGLCRTRPLFQKEPLTQPEASGSHPPFPQPLALKKIPGWRTHFPACRRLWNTGSPCLFFFPVSPTSDTDAPGLSGGELR